MSCCCRMGQNNSKKTDLDRLLDKDALASALKFKILVLGAGESGKSTVIKQLKLIYQRKEMTEEWFMSYVPILHANVFQCMQTLLQNAEQFGYKYEGEIAEAAARIGEIKLEEEPVLTPEFAKDIDALWKNEVTQKTYDRRGEFWILESCSYYFEHVFEMAAEDFKPTEEHVVMARARTTGIITTELVKNDICWQIVDVGGQRSERKKWIQCFDDVKAIIFVVNLAGYNTVLFEDQKKNRMKEEIELFQQICSNAIFKLTPIFLFLNKKDLFEAQLRKFPLSDLFPEYKGDDVHSGISFISEQFRTNLDPSKQEGFKSWEISARFKKDVEYSFQELMTILITANKASIKKALTAVKKDKKTTEKLEEKEKTKRGKEKEKEKEKVESSGSWWWRRKKREV